MNSISKRDKKMFQRLYCIFFFVVCYRLGSASAVQSFSEEPTSSIVKPGESLNLNCHVNDKEGDCMWQKDYTPIGVSKGKYEWAGNEKSGDCTLKILHAQADLDEGSWSCQVTWSSITARDSLNSARIYLSVGDNCNVGKPCSKQPGPDMDENGPPEKSGDKDSLIAERRNPVNSFSTHHRPPYSSFYPKYDRHPFSAIFSYSYWRRTTKAYIISPKSKSRDFFSGLHHLHFHHDHDLAFG